MPDDDKMEYLAYERDYQNSIDKLINPIWDKVREGEPIVTENLYALLLARL